MAVALVESRLKAVEGFGEVKSLRFGMSGLRVRLGFRV